MILDTSKFPDFGRVLYNILKQYFLTTMFLFVSLCVSIYRFYVLEAQNIEERKERVSNLSLLVTSIVGFLSLFGLYKGIPNLYDQKDLLEVAKSASGAPNTSGNDAVTYILNRVLDEVSKFTETKSFGEMISNLTLIFAQSANQPDVVANFQLIAEKISGSAARSVKAQFIPSFLRPKQIGN